MDIKKIIIASSLAIALIPLNSLANVAGFQYDPTSSLSGSLISHYKLEQSASDIFGSNSGTLNGVTFSNANGKVSGGAGFNGTSDYISITDNASLRPTGNASLSFWAKTSNAAGAGVYPLIFQSYSQVTTVAGFEVMQSAGNSPNPQKLRFVVGRNTGFTQGADYQEAFSTNVINDGNWHHYVSVYNGSNLTVYTDGVAGTPVAYTNGIAYAATNYVRIGDGNLSGTEMNFFNGSIDELSFYGKALSSAEIMNLYRTGFGQTMVIDGARNMKGLGARH